MKANIQVRSYGLMKPNLWLFTGDYLDLSFSYPLSDCSSPPFVYFIYLIVVVSLITNSILQLSLTTLFILSKLVNSKLVLIFTYFTSICKYN